MAKKNVSNKKKKASGDRAAGKPATGRGSPWSFPKNSLEDGIQIAQAIEEKNAGKPLDAETLAKYVGYRRSNDWRFLDRLKSANLYGLVSGSGSKVKVTLKPVGEGIVAPSSPTQRKKALAEAFDNVSLFKQVAKYYEGKSIPEDEYFANTLVREFKVPRDRVEHFIRVFTSSLQYIKAFSPGDGGQPILTSYRAEDKKSADGTRAKTEGGGTPGREFLDTCFVLMPFGGWYDRYYEEIYRPAIKDAGFEPFRADDLFNTGSVVEQIWEQVNKSKVLLAELTGKNPNVFYELGLSHASCKPVVFVTGALNDVPFDLRHLRHITYDVNEPGWSDRLRKDIGQYLRNAKADPAKSIPQPFRDLSGRDDESENGVD